MVLAKCFSLKYVWNHSPRSYNSFSKRYFFVPERQRFHHPTRQHEVLKNQVQRSLGRPSSSQTRSKHPVAFHAFGIFAKTPHSGTGTYPLLQMSRPLWALQCGLPRRIGGATSGWVSFPLETRGRADCAMWHQRRMTVPNSFMHRHPSDIPVGSWLNGCLIIWTNALRWYTIGALLPQRARYGNFFTPHLLWAKWLGF